MLIVIQRAYSTHGSKGKAEVVYKGRDAKNHVPLVTIVKRKKPKIVVAEDRNIILITRCCQAYAECSYLQTRRAATPIYPDIISLPISIRLFKR